MDTLALPSFNHRIIRRKEKPYIFDSLRKKYVYLTPEEWVRQHMISYLTEHLHYPASLMRAECKANSSIHRTYAQRADIFVYSQQVDLVMIVECKAAKQRLSHSTLKQMMRYNEQRVPFILFTNGMHHFCFSLAKEQGHYVLLDKIPTFEAIKHFLLSSNA